MAEYGREYMKRKTKHGFAFKRDTDRGFRRLDAIYVHRSQMTMAKKLNLWNKLFIHCSPCHKYLLYQYIIW